MENKQNDIRFWASEIIRFCKRLYNKNYICGTEGNVSIRLPDGRIMITPRGINKGFLSDDDIIICDSDGVKIEGKHEPSSESKLHVSVYKWRSDVHSICHTHPQFATAFSLSGVSFNKAILPEFVATLGAAPLVRYATPGTDGLLLTLRAYIDRYDAFLLQAHGTLTLGNTLWQAFNRTEILEKYARIIHTTSQIKKIELISKGETEYLLNIAGREDLLEYIVTKDEDEL